MRTLTQSLTLTSIAMAVRSGFRGALDGLSTTTKAALIHMSGGRRLLKSYPKDGPLMQVRRSTDNAALDIGSLKNGWIDAATAAAFAGAGDLFVVTGYDQRVTSIEQRRNLFLWTEDLSKDTWQKMPGITAVSSPDGWWKIAQGSTTTVQRILGRYIPAFSTERMSIDAKAGEETVLAIGVQGIGSALFDLVAGTHTPPQLNVYGHAMTPLPGGGYRCSVTFRNTTASASAQDIAQRFWGVFQGTPGHGLFLRQPQSEAGEIETAYQRVDAGTEYPKRFVGAVVDSHDLTQSTATAQPGLRITPAVGRRNLFGGAGISAIEYSRFGVTVVGDVMTENSVASTQHRLFRDLASIMGTAGGTVSIQTKVKRSVGTRHFQYGLGWAGGNARIYFDLAAGTVGSIFSSIAAQPAGTVAPTGVAGEYLCTVTFEYPAAASPVVYFAMANATTVGAETYTGDGSSSLSVRDVQFEYGPVTAYQQVNGSGTIVFEAGQNHQSSMVFNGTSSHFERPATDWPANLHTLPEVGANINTGTNNSTFDTGTGNWLFSSAAGTFSAVSGAAQITGVSDYVGKAIRNNGPVLGKNIILSLDVWSNFGGVNVFAQNPQSPFTTYVSTIVDSRTPRRVQLFVPNCPVPNILIAVTPWAGSASQIVNFDNVTVRELDPDAAVGVTVAMRINPSTASTGVLWSMRDNSTGFITVSRLSTGAIQLEHRSDASITKAAASTETVAVGSSATIVARWNFVTGTASIRINGTQQTLLTAMDIAGGLTARRHIVGASRPGSSVVGFYAGSLSDPIIIGTHVADADCQIIESALGATP